MYAVTHKVMQSTIRTNDTPRIRKNRTDIGKTKGNLPVRHDDDDGHRLWWLGRLPPFQVQPEDTLQACLRAQRVHTGRREPTQLQCLQICGHRRPRFGLLLDRCVARAGRGFGSGPVEEREWEEAGRFPGLHRLGGGLAPPTTRAPS